jgi:hypothetical protein
MFGGCSGRQTRTTRPHQKRQLNEIFDLPWAANSFGRLFSLALDIEQLMFNGCAIRSRTQVNAMHEDDRQRMRELCTVIAAEQDPRRIGELVEELNLLLDTKQDGLNRKQAKAS